MPAQVRLFMCLKDNFGVLLHDPGSGRTAAIDAPEAAPVEAALRANGWKLTDILVTHHHGDVESAIYVISGTITMRWGDRLEHEAKADAGDFIFVPEGVIHQEINASADTPVVSIVARGGDNIVVNVDLSEK